MIKDHILQIIIILSLILCILDVSDLNEYISTWLDSSQNDDNDNDHTEEGQSAMGNIIDEAKIVDHLEYTTNDVGITQESIVLKSILDSGVPAVETKSTNSYTTISSAGLEELYRLANATEEFDAWVPTSEQVSQWYNLEVTSVLNSALDSSKSDHFRVITNGDL